MKPLVSILIPAYNAESWIADTIRSAQRQTWGRTEVIIVDDGSTDRTLSIARDFAPEGVTVVSQDNQGASAARNKALSLSKGDYIQWLDADDLLAGDKISKQMESIARCNNNRVLFSSEWGRFMYCASRAKFIPTPLWMDLSPVEWLVRKLGQNLHMQPATWLISRELTEAAGPWDTRLSLDDDGEYFCRVIMASAGIHFVSGAKTFYRMSGFNSLSNVDQSDRKLASLWISLQAHIRCLRSLEDSARTQAACVTYLQNWLHCFYPDRLDLVRQAEQLAITFGGHLSLPQLRWKYAWIENLLGREAARRAQVLMPNLKTFLTMSWDKTMFHLQKSGPV